MSNAKMEEIKSVLYSQGSLDERKIFSFASAQSLPSGGFGLVALGMKGETLIVFDAKPSSATGEVTGVLFEIPVKEIENLKIGKSMFILPYMKFSWQGGNFCFKNYGKCGIEEAIKEASRQ